jgi:hypothetical protein
VVVVSKEWLISFVLRKLSQKFTTFFSKLNQTLTRPWRPMMFRRDLFSGIKPELFADFLGFILW